MRLSIIEFAGSLSVRGVNFRLGMVTFLDALFAANRMAFRPIAKRVFIWITDATYHEKNTFTTCNKQEVISEILAADAIVHTIGTPSLQTDWYSPFTQATGGIFFYSITGNFHHIPLDIGSLKASNRYLLSYATQQPKAAPNLPMSQKFSI